MNEQEIREQVWKIVQKEIKKQIEWIHNEGINPTEFDDCAQRLTHVIQRQINQLLNKYEAILVYQP